MKLHYRLALLIFVFFQSTAHAECKGSSVEKLAKDFFTSHRNFSSAGPLAVKDLLTPDFYTVLEREAECTSEGELCAIEADPWMSAQDGEIEEPISFSITNQTTLKASVKMDYIFVISKTQKESRSVTLQFLKINNDTCWLLEDFITPKDGSLKKNMQAWYSQHGKAL